MCRVLRLFQFRGHTLRSKILRGKNPTEIHGALSKVCGEFTVDRCTVSLWDKHFHGSCVSIYNDPRPGRQRTSTDERSVKLVADALEEDRRGTCEELSRAMGAKISQENAQEPTSVSNDWATHSPLQCSPAHRGSCNQKNFAIMGGKCYLMRPIVHNNYEQLIGHLFPKLKEPLRGK